MSKYLSGSAKRKIRIKKDEEIKKLRGSLNMFVVKNNLDNAGKWYIYLPILLNTVWLLKFLKLRFS